MQPFFISEEKLARQAYRYDNRYRLAALVLMVATCFAAAIPRTVFRSKQDQRRRSEPA